MNLLDLAQSPFTPSTEVWYPDGTVVVVAGGEGFRVYAGILVKHSRVLAEMLATPNLTQAKKPVYHSGCPVVFLPDALEDTRNFLKVLNDGR